MPQELLKARLKEELPAIGRALDSALHRLPPACRPVACHVMGAGGKRLRPFLAVICARMAGLAGETIYSSAICMELLHAATLLHDDVLDGADTRRGRPAAHEIYRVHDTILAGDAMLALGSLILAETGNAALSRCYAEATMATAAGEIMEMASLRDASTPPEKYLEIARGKTACLMAQACALGACAAHAGDSFVAACRSYGNNLGIGFQLVDDVLDFAPEEQTGKPCGGDLREGKLTPPIRLYRDSLPLAESELFNQKFNSGSFSSEEIGSIAAAVQSFTAQALHEASEFLDQAKFALDPLPDSREKQVLLELAAYVAERRH